MQAVAAGSGDAAPTTGGDTLLCDESEAVQAELRANLAKASSRFSSVVRAQVRAWCSLAWPALAPLSAAVRITPVFITSHDNYLHTLHVLASLTYHPCASLCLQELALRLAAPGKENALQHAQSEQGAAGRVRGCLQIWLAGCLCVCAARPWATG